MLLRVTVSAGLALAVSMLAGCGGESHAFDDVAVSRFVAREGADAQDASEALVMAEEICTTDDDDVFADMVARAVDLDDPRIIEIVSLGCAERVAGALEVLYYDG